VWPSALLSTYTRIVLWLPSKVLDHFIQKAINSFDGATMTNDEIDTLDAYIQEQAAR